MFTFLPPTAVFASRIGHFGDSSPALLVMLWLWVRWSMSVATR